MDAPILPRDDVTQYRTYGGQGVVLLDSASANYREWVVFVETRPYCIVQEEDTWTLLRKDWRTGRWREMPERVETFLARHKLILAA